MELQIQDLVTSIRKEGLEKAQAEAARIIAEAQAKADEIVCQAKAEAKAVLESAEKEISILRQSAVVTAQQAQRDAALSFKKEIQAVVGSLLQKEVSKQMDGEALGVLIKAAVASEDLSKLAVEVSKVSQALEGQLAQEIRDGLEIRPVKDINAGFRISAKDGSGYFDCTDEEVAMMLAPFVGEMSL